MIIFTSSMITDFNEMRKNTQTFTYMYNSRVQHIREMKEKEGEKIKNSHICFTHSDIDGVDIYYMYLYIYVQFYFRLVFDSHTIHRHTYTLPHFTRIMSQSAIEDANCVKFRKMTKMKKTTK